MEYTDGGLAALAGLALRERPTRELLERRAERLLQADPARRMVLIRGSESFRMPQLIPLLIDQGQALRHRFAYRALDTYRAACQIAELLPAGAYHADLQAEALANLGNAYRAIGRLPQAQRLLERAAARQDAGSGDPLLEARLAVLTGTLDLDLGQPEAAKLSFRHAIECYLEIGEEHLAGRAMLSLGRCFTMTEELDQAIRFLCHGLEIVNLNREPALALTGTMALAKALGSAGRAQEGLALMEPLPEVAAAVAGTAAAARCYWLSGNLLRACDRSTDAEHCLRLAREDFAEQGLPLDAALVCLDLALLFAECGEHTLVTVEASRAHTLLCGAGADAQAIAALALLKGAALRKSASAAVVRHTTRRVRAALR
jgi:tetratricopeptide (TPR) repeat protein